MMKDYFYNLKIGLAAILLLFLVACKNQTDSNPVITGQTHGIIPLPLNSEMQQERLLIDKNTVLVNNSQFLPAVKVIEDAFNLAMNVQITKKETASTGINIRFINDNSLVEDAYQIIISLTGIELKAKTPVGGFYAAQSLRQMIWKTSDGEKKDSLILQCIKIADSPKYAWRGFHLDVSRHFFTKEYVLEIIDWLAYYKLNKLHLHLTDDQGWRVQIDQFPLLTEVGAWRTFNNLDSICIEKARTNSYYQIDPRFIKTINGKQVYGGFYTKQDIRDIIDYATAHYIDVIPEIDMPGHMSAAIRAYPYLSCTDSVGWGNEFSYPMCPCREEVMDFSRKVWDEIAALFPYSVVHIGSDEVEKNTWETSTDCQNFMDQHNLTDINEIQNFFVTQMQQHLESKGKTVVAWDDVIDGKVDNNLIMMYWREWLKDSPEKCAQNGNRIVLTPWDHFYISSPHTDESLENLYMFKPENTYSTDVNEKVIGLQSCVWTEEIPSENQFEYLVYPRMQALSEVCWSPSRDWHSFRIRIESHLKYMSTMNIHYRKPGWAN
jgi:hexosaminidase